MMKKTLVALAAVAAAGGAFAQATMTGFLAFGYIATQSSAGATAGGMGTDTANLDFAISEEIENLGKVSGKMGVRLKNKDTSALARDAEIKVDMGSMGSLKMDSVYSTSWLSGTAMGGSNQYCGFGKGDCGGDVGIFSTYGYNDNFSYSMPLTSNLSVSVTHTEPSTSATNEGTGAAAYGDTKDYQRYNTYSATYKAGGFVVTGGYRTYDMANNATTNSNYRHRGAFSYDLGVAQIGAGYEQSTATYGNTTTDSLMSVVLPIPSSPLTLSAAFGQRVLSGNKTASADTTYSASLYNAVYTLSKRTYLLATYTSNQNAGTSNPNFFLTTINHAF
jgi:hypothetical protein